MLTLVRVLNDTTFLYTSFTVSRFSCVDFVKEDKFTGRRKFSRILFITLDLTRGNSFRLGWGDPGWRVGEVSSQKSGEELEWAAGGGRVTIAGGV